jgi:mitochondrial fission process protein 1
MTPSSSSSSENVPPPSPPQEQTLSQRDNKNITKEYNVFRDSLVRYLGYANEVGESFRYQYPRLVVPSYAIAFGYCLADASSTGYRAAHHSTVPHQGEVGRSNSNHPQPSDQQQQLQLAAVGALDTLLWQSLASVMIPGAAINVLVRAARFAVRRSPVALPALAATWVPTAVGLGSVPFIVHPIDASVDYLLDSTTRPYVRNSFVNSSDSSL